MSNDAIIRKLIALRYCAEREAEVPIQQIECTLLTALNDVCNALDMTREEKRRVMGDAFDLLGEDGQSAVFALPLFQLPTDRRSFPRVGMN